MGRNPNYDQGFSIRVDRDTEKLIRAAAKKEDRMMKVVVARAVREYASKIGVK